MYRDSEASALAIATSGNGLELLCTKAVPRWCWATFWAAGATSSFFISTFPGIEAWMEMEIGRFAFITAMAAIALLPLVSTSGRMFVRLLQWGLPASSITVWLGFAFHGFTTGDWTLAGFWGAFMVSWYSLLWFRTRLFLRGWFTTGCLAFGIYPTFACINDHTHGSVQSRTLNECITANYQALAVMLGLIGAFVIILVGREIANNALAWRAARASRELHRHAPLNPEL